MAMLVYQRVTLLVSYELSTMSPYSLRFRNPWKLSWSQVLRKVHFWSLKLKQWLGEIRHYIALVISKTARKVNHHQT